MKSSSLVIRNQQIMWKRWVSGNDSISTYGRVISRVMVPKDVQILEPVTTVPYVIKGTLLMW